jgi:hypothetical protein
VKFEDLTPQQRRELDDWGHAASARVAANESEVAAGSPQPLLELARLRYQRRIIEEKTAQAVEEARRQGDSWHKIGLALGTTAEGARKRHRQPA